MKNKYYLLLLVILLLTSIPSLWHKVKTENSADTIEFSIDYLSLLSLSEQSKDPDVYLDAMLMDLKKEGFTTLTIPNNTFASLEDRGLLSVVSSDELGAMQLLAASNISIDRHLSYLLLLDQPSSNEIMGMVYKRFSAHHIEELTVNGHKLIGIDVPITQLLNASIPYLERDINLLTNPPYDFSLVVKLDNNWEGNEEVAVEQLGAISEEKVSTIYFADSGVLGYPVNHQNVVDSLPTVPFAYKEYFSSEEKQKGIDWLASYSQYNMVRLHVIPHKLFEANYDSSYVLVDRMTKAASERNIRLFHIQFPWEVEGKSGKQLFTKSFAILKESKEKLVDKGYTIGTSKPFTDKMSPWVIGSQWTAALAGILLCFLLVKAVLPKFAVFSVAGLLLVLLSSIWIEPFAWQVIALAFVVSLPLLGVQFILTEKEKKKEVSLLSNTYLFLGVSAYALVCGLLLSSMHSERTHLLYVESFRGVSIAHILPPILTVILMLIFYKLLNKENLIKGAASPLRIYQAVLLLIVGTVGAYYISRTGNSGILLPFETEFRNLLENTFGVRPRTKEFLLCHPILLLVLYYWHQHKWVKWGLPIAIIGQLSIINTFTHFHTPVWISLQRGVYGMALGLLIGLLCIGFVEAVKWLLKKKKMHDTIRRLL